MEKNRKWACDMIKYLQKQAADEIFVPEIGHHLQHDVLEALEESGLDILPELKQANQQVLAHYNRFWQKQPSPDPREIVREMELEGLDDVHEIARMILSQLRLMPNAGDQVRVLDCLAVSTEERLREVVGLMMLHPDPPVRRQVPAILVRCAANGLISPVTLRRMIVLRNWLPLGERPMIDLVIKSARQARVDCAPTGKGRLISLYVSGVDGSGAQAIWMVIRSGDTWLMSHLLVRLGAGIREIWCTRSSERLDLETILERADGDLALMPVKAEYLELVLAHFIAEGHERGQAPPMEVLHIAEALGGSHWDSQVLSLEALHFPEATAFNSEYEHAVIESSDSWALEEGYAYSWFEDDGEVDRILDKKTLMPFDMMQAVEEHTDLVMEFVLEPRRNRWYGCFLMMALVLQKAKPRPRPSWKKFYILASKINQGMPLENIPIMGLISARTIYAALLRLGKIQPRESIS
jgi:hypothetical protein